MITQTFAANAFSGARFIGAVALGFVFFDFALSHRRSSMKSLSLSSLVESAAKIGAVSVFYAAISLFSIDVLKLVLASVHIQLYLFPILP